MEENTNKHIDVDNLSPVSSVKDWTINNFLVEIPIVGFIFLIIKALDSSSSKSVSNWAKAKLISKLIAFTITIIIVVLLVYFLKEFVIDNIDDISDYLNDISNSYTY